MAVTITPLPREFYLDGRKIADPNPALSIEQVRTFYQATYPALNNASFTEETTARARKVTFTTAVGSKG